jgi:hypothetical protein
MRGLWDLLEGLSPYRGQFIYNGELYDGNHEPIVSEDLWLKVQQETERRGYRAVRRKRYHHPSKGLVSCSCSRQMGLDQVKGKYLYSLCLMRTECSEPYVPAEIFEEAAMAILDDAVPSVEWLARIEEGLADEIAKREEHGVGFSAQLEMRLTKLDMGDREGLPRVEGRHRPR